MLLPRKAPLGWPRSRAQVLARAFILCCVPAWFGCLGEALYAPPFESGTTAASPPTDGATGLPATVPEQPSIPPPVGAGTDWGRGSATPPPSSAGVFELQRLLPTQIDNTLRDLLGVTTGPASSVLSSDVIGGSGFPTTGLVTPLEAERLDALAEQVAITVRPRLVPGQLLPCNPAQAGEAACARQFISDFGARAFRRPLTTTEVEEFVSLFQTARTTHGDDFPRALSLVVQAVLQSPDFLYVGGMGPGVMVPLSGPALASRLSYFLWGTMPDEALLAAARADRLRTPAQVEEQVRRMLADPRARDSIARFHEQWLGISPLIQITEPVASASLLETRTFAAETVLNGDGLLETLLRAPYSYLTTPLSDVYGVSVTANAPVKTQLSNRFGLLTHASVLTVQSDPIRRGKLVRENLLCQHLPGPPPDVPALPPIPENATRREIFELHSKAEPCRSCHVLMDPIGFGFEKYDGKGRLATGAGAEQIDDRGEVKGLEGRDVSFTGAEELTALLVKSPTVQACVTAQWVRFALGRHESAQDKSTLYQAITRFDQTQHNVRELIVAITLSDSFRYHTSGGTP